MANNIFKYNPVLFVRFFQLLGEPCKRQIPNEACANTENGNVVISRPTTDEIKTV